MLPRPHRLTDKRDFKRVMQKGRSFFIREFGVKLFNRRDGQPTRIGIVVSKKITRTIVKRNRAKRQIRHIFIPLLPLLPDGFDIIFLARPECMKLEFKEMEEKIGALFKKIGLVR
jgi:ribonuclease P protein component